tara:strand:+ start:136 stop:441 length:306 start_codon:yes stop_codon:yes gene_type:complete
MAIYVTKEDKFVWLDLTDKLINGEKWKWLGHELYAVFDDDSEELLESEDEVDEALKLGLKVCMEVGFLEPEQKQRWWHKAEKIKVNGYFFVKYNDIRFGSV